MLLFVERGGEGDPKPSFMSAACSSTAPTKVSRHHRSKTNPILKDKYPHFYCWVINFSVTKEVHIVRMEKSVTAFNRRAANGVYFRQMPSPVP